MSPRFGDQAVRPRPSGLVVGLIGAGAVAGWFLFLDLLAGRPLATPSLLGQILLFGKSEPTAALFWPAIAAYSVVHLIVFMLFGVFVTKLAEMAAKSPLALFGLFTTAVAFEFVFVGLTAGLFYGVPGEHFPAWKVLSANALATFAMGGYLLPREPGIFRQLARNPLGG